jgi:hypothetical protein
MYSPDIFICVVYMCIIRENEASLVVLTDLFVELDGMDEVCLCSCVVL